MRISTAQISNTALSAITDQQSSLLELQQQIATGRRILNPSDDPSGAARALNLNQADAVIQQYNTNADFATSRNRLEEATLDGVNNVLQRVRELAVQGNNDTQTNATRRSIALEIRQRLDELIDLANTRDGNGEYLFSGFQGFTQPFTVNANGTFNYNGDDGQRFVQIGPNRQVAVSDSGTEVFRRVRNGNGTFATAATAGNGGGGVINAGSLINPAAYSAETFTISFVTNSSGQLAYNVVGASSGQVIPTLPLDAALDAPAFSSDQAIVFNGSQVTISGTPAVGDSFSVSPSVNQDIFSTLQDLVSALESPTVDNATRTALHNRLNSFLTDVDQGIGKVLDIRAGIGARLNSVDDQLDLNESTSLQLRTNISQIEDLDYADAITRLELQRNSLDAAQRSFLRIQDLSLFNFL